MRSIRRPEAYEVLFKSFTDTSHPMSGKPIFTTQRDMLCFLAVLGFHADERTPLSGKLVELDSRVFENHEQSRDILYLVALAGTRDANILHPEREDEMLTVFEEYVATGLRTLQRWMTACPDDHIGDQAILSAIRRDGFFGTQETPLGKALEEVEF